MKKKIVTSILLLCLLSFSLTGCKKDDTAETAQENVITEETSNENAIVEETSQEDVISEEPTQEVASINDTTALVCSGCEVEKVCGIYTAGNQEYIVCYDCSNAFIEHHKDIALKQICSGCQEEKICGTYIIDGQEYIVCPDDFEEFAYGMNLY